MKTLYHNTKKVETMENFNQQEIYADELIIFLRKSRSDNPNETVEETLQRHERQLQEHALKTFGSYIKEENIYREVVSGGEELEQRPEFLKVLHRLEKGNVRGVLVVDPQRLSRSGMYGAGDIINAFYYTDTLIVTPNKTYDLKNKYDKKFIEMELMQGAEYLEYTKEKLAIGRLTSVKEGKFVGSTPPFGYDKEKIKKEKGYKLVLNDESEIVRMIFDLFLDDVGTSNVANTLNKLKIKSREQETWTPMMVRNILENPTYYGMLTWEKRKTITKLVDGALIKTRPRNEKYLLFKGLHDPIVSEEEFKIAQDKLRNGNHPRRPSNINEISNPLAGIVKCSVCGRTMVRRPFKKKKLKNPKFLYDIDKTELLTLLRQHKDASFYSLNKIKDILGVSKDQVVSWFTPNVNKFYVSKTFIAKWPELKELLNIKTNKYDEALTSVTFEHTQPPILMCPLSGCTTVSSDLDEVETRVLKALESHLNDYKYFLDNYEEEIIKDSQNNAKQLKRVEDKIAALKKALKNIRRDYNMELFTYEEYMEDKADYEAELKELEEIRKTLANADKEEKIHRYKKAVPKLETAINQYNEFSLPQKNQILKSLIEEIVYTKMENGRWNKDADFALEITMKI